MNVIRKQRGAVIFENDCFCYICRDLLLVMISYCEHFTIGSLSANTQQLQWFTADVSCQCVCFFYMQSLMIWLMRRQLTAHPAVTSVSEQEVAHLISSELICNLFLVY